MLSLHIFKQYETIIIHITHAYYMLNKPHHKGEKIIPLFLSHTMVIYFVFESNLKFNSF